MAVPLIPVDVVGLPVAVVGADKVIMLENGGVPVKKDRVFSQLARPGPSAGPPPGPA